MEQSSDRWIEGVSGKGSLLEEAPTALMPGLAGYTVQRKKAWGGRWWFWI